MLTAHIPLPAFTSVVYSRRIPDGRYEIASFVDNEPTVVIGLAGDEDLAVAMVLELRTRLLVAEKLSC
jgi:hypothetical protein